ncbi:MAG: protein-disulfide reductase DsbD domain-containing protein [Sphingomonadaceae bacterium]
MRRLILWLALLAGSFAAQAQSSAQLPHTRVELVSDTAAPAPGQKFTLGIIMTPQPGWHTYWENPGDSGMPTRARWTLPAGVEAGPLIYPTPDTFVVAGIMNHVYKGEATLLVDVQMPAYQSGSLPLALKLDWLVCDDQLCVPESATLDLTLAVGDGTPAPAQRQRFAAAREALPRALAEPASFAVEEGRLRLAVPLADAANVKAVHFFPHGDDSSVFSAAQSIGYTNNALIIETEAVADASPQSISGVLRVERDDGPIGIAFTAEPGAVPAGQPLAASAPPATVAFLPAFALALAGGLLLNLMPCVFPILSLKALSLARAGESQRQARVEGVAYTAGVVLVCVALGGIVLLLARTGAGAGWAFQLQDPRVILLLMLLTLAIGLNFAGLFEVNPGNVSAGQSLAARPGAQGAFWTGTLAAFVATPCTGPFMAGALGAALLLPPAAGLAVFAGLGLGLALPFLLIGFVPALRRLLPKPGAWMLTFRRILAIPMLLTTLALAWVLGRQAGASGLTLGLAFALLLGLGLWWVGLRQQRQRPALIPGLVAILALLIAPAALARLPQPVTGAVTTDGLNGQPFSPAALTELRATGAPVFLYFTADWCVTCKVNERGALASDAVMQAFDAAGIKVMVGDWTRANPDIAHFIAERGRAGIPLYLFYGRDGEITELPQLLTVERLVRLGTPSRSGDI